MRTARQQRRRTIVLVAALSLVAPATLVATLAAPANAIECPPPFDVLPGCDSAGDEGGADSASAGTWSTRTTAGMSTHVYLPESEPALPAGRALMINLHGCIQTATDLREGGNWTSTADAYGMVVAIPDAPNGGVLLGCWDYYDSNHSRSNPSRHDDNLLDLVDALLADDSLGIDPDQVYISGLSSGGGETMVMGCLAPDVFAGVGINAGPTVGTSSGEIGFVATTATEARNTCTGFAGSYADGFDTQVTSVIYGSDDTTVATGYNTLNAEVMAQIYGAGSQSSFSLSGLDGANTSGSGALWSDGAGPRVSLIQNTGMGHNWPAGDGPGGSYITTNSINYSAYLTEFFFENNRRVDRDGQPSPTPTPTSTPTPTPTPDPTCWTAANAEHQTAGRAVSYGVDPYNPYYALGSQDYLGLGDATVTSLEQISTDHYEQVDAC